jgi:hypothetical protein
VSCTWIQRNEPEAYAMAQEYKRWLEAEMPEAWETLTSGDLPAPTEEAPTAPSAPVRAQAPAREGKAG